MLKKLLITLTIFTGLLIPVAASAQVFNLNQIASSTQSSPYTGLLDGDGVSSHKATTVATSSLNISTSNLIEGSNLFFTTARALASFITNLSATSSVASITTLPNLSLAFAQITGVPAFDTFGYPFPGNATSTNISFSGGLTGTLTGSITGNAATVTNGVYTTTFNGLFDNRLSASSSISSITTLPNLSLPYTQLSGTPTIYPYPFPGGATSSAVTFNGGVVGNVTGNVTGSAGSVTNAVTFNNGGAGGSSGSTYNGASTLTVSYNTIGAQVAGTYVTSVSGTANQITSSGGTTPTLSLPNHVIFPIDYVASAGSTTNATTTNFAIVGSASNCGGTSALTTNSSGVVGCTAQPQGTVTAVSVASSNGFAGSSSGGATPSLTLSTTITGLLKGNGTAITAATPGTDYDVFGYPFPSNATTSSLAFGGLTVTGIGAGTVNANGAGGLYTSATTTASCAGTTSCTAFTIFGPTPVTITGGGDTFAYPFPNNATSTTLTFGGGLVSNGSTTVAGLSSGLVGNNNGLLYGFASSSLFGYTPLNPTRNINTTYPLQGGGNLSSDLTLTTAFGTTSTWGIGNNQVIYTNNAGLPIGIATSSPSFNIGGTALNVTGVVALPNGGTGLNSVNANSIIYSNSGGTAYVTTSTSTLSIGGNAATVTNGVYTTTFNTLFDNRLSASSSIAGITTLPNLSLPYSQLTGVPAFDTFGYPFPSNATTSSLAFGGVTITGAGTGCAQFISDVLSSTGTACGSGGGSTFAFPWTPTTNFGVNTNATSTPISFLQGIFASSTSVIASTTFAINGNVGVGTSSPAAKLTIVSTASADATPALVIDGATGSFNADLALNRGSNTGTEEANIDFNTAGINNWQLGIQNNNTSDFELWDGTNDPVFTVKSGLNNIGFGTTTPFGDFAINADYGDALPGNIIFNIASSSATATTSLFNISNTGAINTSLATGFVQSTAGALSSAALTSSNITTALGFTPISGNQTITLSGVVTGSGATAITTAFGSQTAGVLGSAITGNTSVLATSTLYGTVQNSKVLAGVNGSLLYVATTTASCSAGITCSYSGGANNFSIAGNALTLSMFPTIGANTVIGNLTGGTATPTAFATSSLFAGTTGQVAWFSGAGLLTGTSSLLFTNATSTFASDVLIQKTSQNAFQINDNFLTQDLLFTTASTTGSIFTVAATTSPNLGAGVVKLFDVDQYGHFTASSTGATPQISSCGTGSPVMNANANDATGSFTTGTSASACTVTFAHAYATTPIVVISDSNTSAVADVSAISTTAFTVSLASALSADVVYYIVVQP